MSDDAYSNIYTRRVLAGEFQVVCPWLLRELVELGLWNDDMKNMIIANNVSVQNIDIIPDDVKAIYKTVWEISQKNVLDMAADRGAFICQSQSLNVHLQSPTMGQLVSGADLTRRGDNADGVSYRRACTSMAGRRA